MPALDSIAHAPMVDGPTQLAGPMRALGRQEPFQLQAAPARPVELATRSRPMTHSVDHQLHASKAVVLSRTSNLNPDNAGQDDQTAIWGVSDPYLGQDPATASGLPQGIMVPALIGAAIGAFMYLRS